MRARFWLYLLIVCNTLLTIISALQLAANVFVLKASQFAPVQAWSLDLPQQLLYYSPLLWPLWIRVLFQQSPELFQRPTRRTLLWIFAGVVLSLLTSFPFAHVDLGSAPDAPGGPGWYPVLRHLWQMLVIAGLARPGAMLLSMAGLFVVLRRRSAIFTINERTTTRLFFAALLGAIVLRVALAGPAVPRLEDEVAYHVQALIFESGRLRGELEAPGEISGARMGEILQLPYVFFDVANESSSGKHSANAHYYSAHFHGWSAILAALAQVHLKAYANALLALLNFWLIFALLRCTFHGTIPNAMPGAVFGPQPLAGALVLFLYVCAPDTTIMTGTYMSHTASQTLLLLLLLVHQRLARTGPRVILYVLLTFAVFEAFVFVRLQTLVPALFALVVADVLLLSVSYVRRARKTRSAASTGATSPNFTATVGGILVRLLVLAVAVTIALFVYSLYSRALGLEELFYTRAFMDRFFEAGCQTIGWGPGHGCFPTYGSLGHSFRKFLLNGFDLLSTLNHELSPGGLPLLPIAVLLIARNWRTVFDPEQFHFKYLLVFLAVTGVYSLYFHNGGESYRGRYVLEAVFLFYMILARLTALEFESFFARVGGEWRAGLTRVFLILTPVLLITNVALNMRGDYFSKFIQPYHNVNDFAQHSASDAPTVPEHLPIRNTTISVRDLLEQHPDREPETNAFYYPAEFQPGEKIAIPLASMKAFLNLGYSTLVATATRID